MLVVSRTQLLVVRRAKDRILGQLIAGQRSKYHPRALVTSKAPGWLKPPCVLVWSSTGQRREL